MRPLIAIAVMAIAFIIPATTSAGTITKPHQGIWHAAQLTAAGWTCTPKESPQAASEGDYEGPWYSCSITTPDAEPTGLYLCYSKYQVDPGHWSEQQARELIDAGYWLPYATTSNTASTTYIGHGFYLDCRQHQTTNNVAGNDGTNLGPNPGGLFYPIAA